MIRIIQPSMPNYRLDFFRRLFCQYEGDFRVHFSNTDIGEPSNTCQLEPWMDKIGPMIELFPGVQWQIGSLSIPINRGDLIVVCGAPRNLSTLLLLIKVRIMGAKSIWWGQYWSASSRLYRHHIRMRLSHLANALLFYTDSEVSQFHASGWRHRGEVSALNNGLNLREVVHLRRKYDPT